MDIVIYSHSHVLTEGMFGQALIWLIEVLSYLQKHQTRIIFHINCLAYDNLIPRFIVPKISYKLEEFSNTQFFDLKHLKFSCENAAEFDFDVSAYQKANKIWNKYFEFHEVILNKIPIIDSDTTVGIHYRGTDKNSDTSQANAISQEEVILIIKDFLQNTTKEYKAIYCCSDESSFIANMKNNFTNMQIIQYDQIRATEDLTNALFRYGSCVEKNLQDNMTIAALVDMLSLSKCHTVIKTSSALSAFSKIMNPTLQVYTVSAMKERWFPAGLVPAYKSKSAVINKILQRTLQGHVYDGC